MNPVKKFLPFSVLDLAIIKENHTPGDAFNRSMDLARHVEKWGYKRLWLAEHHNMEAVGSSATAVLIGYIAGGTSTIRVGSGGIMLPNHSPLIVAEQFGTLECLYPGRIDLGLGRAPGTDQVTAKALRRGRLETVQEFPQDLEELKLYFSEDNWDAKVRAFPGEGLKIPLYLLGSSIHSAILAANLGLPYAFASHFAPAQFLQAIRYYKENFKPSAQLDKPYVISCVNIIAADEEETAHYLATSFYQLALGIIRGKSYPLKPPVKDMESLWTLEEEAAIRQMMACTFIGEQKDLENDLRQFAKETQVEEIMVCSHIYSHEARLRSYEIIADIHQTWVK